MNQLFTTHRPLVSGCNWLITADHPLAAQAGAEVLARGGNAVEAALAANLALTVVRPHMCGPGGDLFALVHWAAEEKLYALNGSGRAPAGASLDRFTQLGLSAIPETGVLTATVPGAVAGWQALADKFAARPLAELARTAIGLAETGFPVYPELARATAERAEPLARHAASAQVFLPGGNPLQAGTRLCQSDLAATLRTIADKGPDGFYRGPFGQALAQFSQDQGGLFRLEDLQAGPAWQPTWDEPLRADYRGLTLATQPPSSQGIALLMQALMLDNIDIAGLGWGTAELIHTMIEAKKLAFADRNAYVCDPAFHPVPVEQMLDKASAVQNVKRIDPARAATSVPPRRFTSGGEDTVYLAVVDAQGNAVSLIQSLYEYFGSCAMVPGSGVMLHNRSRGFSLDPAHPNRLEPGKRPYHTLHPAMILENGRPRTVLGTPGADGQTQSVIQMITALVDFKADAQQAVSAPRWRSNPDGSVFIEKRFSEKVLQDLAARGHNLVLQDDYAPIMGSAQVINIDRRQGILSGGADPRRQAYAIAG